MPTPSSFQHTFTGPDGKREHWFQNNLLSEQGRVGFVTISEYTWNRPASITLPGGSTKYYFYDSLMRIKNINAGDPGGNTLLDYAYTYDRMDNILSKTTEHGAYQYDYDNLYRLTSTDNPVQDDEGFTYDGVGNRLTSLDVAGEWTYNNNNELNGYDDVSYEYDANGNMVQKISGSAVISYVYNIEDRLSEVWNGEPDTGSLIAEYYYDPFGRRLRKDVEGTRTYFLYSDEGLIGEYDSTGTEIKTYGWKPNSTWSTDPLFMKIGSSYYFYHNDHLGTPQKMTGVNGSTVWSAKYMSFGKALVGITSTITNNLRFPGQYYDGETGLHYNWHRYYDSSTGRYLRNEPLNFAQLQIAKQSLSDKLTSPLNDLSYIYRSKISVRNLQILENSLINSLLYQCGISNPKLLIPYAYVQNSPIAFLDPFGLCLTPSQKLKVSMIAGLGSALGTIVWPAGGSALGGALAGMFAAYFMDGSTTADIINSGISGGLAGMTGAGFASLLQGTTMSGMQAAVTTGFFSGLLESVLLNSDPIFRDSCGRCK